MKNRKLISVFLAVVMLFGALSGTTLTASAVENDNALVLGEAFSVEYTGEYVLLTFTPDKDGWYCFYSTSSNDARADLHDSTGNFIKSGDDAEDTMDFVIVAELKKDELYNLTVNSYEDYDSFTVTVEETLGVESVELVSPPDDQTAIQDFELQTMNPAGLELRFYLSDGSSVTWEYGDDFYVYGHTLEINSDSDENGFFQEVSCANAYMKVYFEVVENPIESIEYTGKGFTFYENTNGYYDEENEFYYYEYTFPSNETVIIHYKDGSSETVTVSQGVKGANFQIGDNQAAVPWTVGGDNGIELGVLGHTDKIPVTILDCPYSGYTVKTAPVKMYYIGDELYGYFDYEDNYYLRDINLSGLSFTLHQEGKEDVEVKSGDIDQQKKQIFGEPYYIEGVCVPAPGMYEVTIQYKGLPVKFSVNVVESPVQEIKVTKDADKLEYGPQFYPILDGMELEIIMTDGYTYDIAFNEDNTRYTQMYNNEFAYVVDFETYSLCVYYNYNEEYEEFYTISCLGVKYDYTKFSFDLRSDFRVDEVISINPYGKGTIINATVNGTQKTIALTPKYIRTDSICSFFASLVKIEDGIFNYYCIAEYNGNDIVGYRLQIVGKEILVDISKQMVFGNLDDSEAITASDALTALTFAVGKNDPDVKQSMAADVDGDGEVKSSDALAILQYSVKKIDSFPVEEMEIDYGKIQWGIN